MQRLGAVGDGGGGVARGEPVTAQVEEASVGPVTRGDEEDQEESGAVDTGPMEDVGEGDERDDEEWGGVGWNEE